MHEFWPATRPFPWHHFLLQEVPIAMPAHPTNYWPENFSAPRPVLCDGSEPKSFALLAGYLDDTSRGWECFRDFYLTFEEAMQEVCNEWQGCGVWWQIVHLPTGMIEASGSRARQAK
jgi:hypothetical protein